MTSKHPDSPDLFAEIESAFNKKRGRATSVEPTTAQDIEDPVTSRQEESVPIISAPKKTKRDDDDKATVNAIRKNMKDMSTTDKNLSAAAEHDDEDLGQVSVKSEVTDEIIDNIARAANPFGGNSNDDDWGEFAEEEEVEEKKPACKEKYKYTFGSTSGFGSPDWATKNQTIPTPSKATTFVGFGSSSGFGGLKPATASNVTSTSSDSNTNTTSAFKPAAFGTTSASSFTSFANATTSPFAVAAATAGNALSSPSQSINSPALSSTSTEHNKYKDTSDNESDESDDGSTTNDETTHTAFGEGARSKVPGVVQQTEVRTGEEGEKNLYETKGTLFVIDRATTEWKERGYGTFRINERQSEDPEKSPQVRLLMRTDTIGRVILNLKPFERMQLKHDRAFVTFVGFEVEQKQDGPPEPKLISYALRLRNDTAATKLYGEIKKHISNFQSSSQD